MDEQELMWVGFVFPLLFSFIAIPIAIAGIIGLYYRPAGRKPAWLNVLSLVAIIIGILPTVIIVFTLLYVEVF